MRLRKHERERKRQRGQYMTPLPLAREVVSRLAVESCSRILEPSCGDGAFLDAILERLSRVSIPNLHDGEIEVIGIEIDPLLAKKSRAVLENRLLGECSFKFEVRQADFFKEYLSASAFDYNTNGLNRLDHESFDLIVGNPPFGGTFDHAIEDLLDARLGNRLGKKIKKETYAFFIVACLDLLRLGGRLIFVCSDTLLTIPTMTGLRHLLMEYGDVKLHDIERFSSETSYPMTLLDFTKRGHPGRVTRNSEVITSSLIRSTPNLSWGITPDLARLFSGPLLGDYFVASSGMTTGKNELFVRKIDECDRIIEPYHFDFYDAPITLSYELERARLGKLSSKRAHALKTAEARGETEKRLSATLRDEPLTVQLPDPRYRPYNKANNRLLFSNPTHCIYWENQGEAVLTFKQTGNWYLRGVGGQPYFGREGITWPLVATRFNARYIPPGYILDSGAPCAFVRDGVDRDEIFFAIGWLLSPLANRVLKAVINHTRNIQSKDFERMPYPWWVTAEDRAAVVNSVKNMISDASSGKIWTWESERIRRVGDTFALPDSVAIANPSLPRPRPSPPKQFELRGLPR